MNIGLHPGVNFINVLRAAFMRADPESAKIQSGQQCRFTLLGPTSVKAEHKMLMNCLLMLICLLRSLNLKYSLRHEFQFLVNNDQGLLFSFFDRHSNPERQIGTKNFRNFEKK